jgi:Na+/H+-dicarboxylate symporter
VKRGRFRTFLNSGNEVMKQLLHIIMKAAPVGLEFCLSVEYLDRNYLERMQNHWLLRTRCILFVIF